MERRDFLKISAAGGAAAALEGCGNPDHHLIRFIPEEDLVPGIATWKPSICTLCPAGCGLLVRVMQGDAEVVRNGQLGIAENGTGEKAGRESGAPDQSGQALPARPGRIAGDLSPRPDPGARWCVRAREARDNSKKLPGTMRSSNSSAQLSALQTDKQENGLAFVTSPLRGQRKTIVEALLQVSRVHLPWNLDFSTMQ